QGRRKEHRGGLVLAVMRGGTLTHCGQVGTGFDERMLRTLRELLNVRIAEQCPLPTPPRTSEPATWVRPELVCEVRHAGWTSAGILRHPAFVGLRPELRPADCVVEAELSTTQIVASQRSTRGEDPPASSLDEALEQLKRLRPNDKWEIAGRRLALTNLDKPFWPDDGYTKRDMIDYYVRMAGHLLPYLRQRPLSMQVFPDGISGKSFWRKDKPSHAPEWIDSWTYQGEKTKSYIVVNEVATLAWVANAGVVDLHPWHSRIDGPNQPDWAVFDLDPFDPATFRDVVDIAKLVKAAIDHYGMHGVIKTSGQTGLQIYVPLRRGPDYDHVRAWVEEVGRAIGQVAPDRITWEWE